MSIEKGGKHVYINGYTGTRTTPYEKRNEIAEYGFGLAAFVGQQVLTFCPLCFQLMSHNGSTIDHIVSKSLMVTTLGWSQDQADERVGAQTNLMQVHSGCNSSKGEKDVFDWWWSGDAKKYLMPADLEEVQGVISLLTMKRGLPGLKLCQMIEPEGWAAFLNQMLRSMRARG